MSLGKTYANEENKAVAYDYFRPSQKVYDCDTQPSLSIPERRAILALDTYELVSIGDKCAYVIYIKDRVVYVVFKGTNNVESVRQDVRMGFGSLFSRAKNLFADTVGVNLTRYIDNEFISTIIGDAEKDVNERVEIKDLPRRYTGHSLGGTLAIAAYIRYGSERRRDECQVFSPYLQPFIAKQVNEFKKHSPIVVWANENDLVWLTGKKNYEAEWYNTLVKIADTAKRRLDFIRERKMIGKATQDELDELPQAGVNYRQGFEFLNKHQTAQREGKEGLNQPGTRFIWHDTFDKTKPLELKLGTMTSTAIAMHYLETMEPDLKKNWENVQREQEIVQGEIENAVLLVPAAPADTQLILERSMREAMGL